MVTFASRWPLLVQFSPVDRRWELRSRRWFYIGEDSFVSDTRWCSPNTVGITSSHLTASTKLRSVHCKPLAGGPAVNRIYTVTIVSLIFGYDSGRRPTHRWRTWRYSPSSGPPWSWSSRNAWRWERTPERTLADTADSHSIEHWRRGRGVASAAAAAAAAPRCYRDILPLTLPIVCIGKHSYYWYLFPRQSSIWQVALVF